MPRKTKPEAPDDNRIDVNPEKHHRVLRVKLTQAEVNQRAVELALALRQIEQLQGVLKLLNKEKKTEIEKVEAQARALSINISAGEVDREVECREEVHWDRGEVMVIREDTNAVVMQRQITDHDRQMLLPAEAEVKAQTELDESLN